MPDANLEDTKKINKYLETYNKKLGRLITAFPKTTQEQYDGFASQYVFGQIVKQAQTQDFNGVNQGNGKSFDVWLLDKNDKPIVMLGEDTHLYIGNNINRSISSNARDNTYNKNTMVEQKHINLIYAKEFVEKDLEKLQQDYNNKENQQYQQSQERIRKKTKDKQIELSSVEQNILELQNKNEELRNKYNRYQGRLNHLLKQQSGILNTVDKDGLEEIVNEYQKNTEKLEKLTKQQQELKTSIQKTIDDKKIKPTSEMKEIEEKINNHKTFLQNNGYIGINDLAIKDINQCGFKNKQQFEQWLKDFNNLKTLNNGRQINQNQQKTFSEFNNFYNQMMNKNQNIQKYLLQQEYIATLKNDTIGRANTQALKNNNDIKIGTQNRENTPLRAGNSYINTTHIPTTIENIKTEMANNKAQIVKLEGDIASLQDRLNSCKKELEASKNTDLDVIKLPSFDEMVSDKKTFLKNIKTYNSTINEINKDTNEKIERRNKLKKEMIELEDKIASAKTELNYCQNRQNVLQKQQSKIKFNNLTQNILGNKNAIISEQKAQQKKRIKTSVKNTKSTKNKINIDKLNTVKSEILKNKIDKVNDTLNQPINQTLNSDSSFSSINSDYKENSLISLDSNDKQLAHDILAGENINNSFVSKNTNKSQINKFNYSITSTNSISVPANTLSISKPQGFALGGDKK